jgi:hypothetical protein
MAKRRDFNEIIENKWLVEFNRKPFDSHTILGFILAFNDEFTLIEEFDNDWFATDGYCVFKNKSVKGFKVYDKDEYFLYEVVKVKKIEPKPVPQISIESWSTILQTVNDNFNLVNIRSELIYKNQCNIGKLAKLGKKTFRLIEIATDASWDEVSTKYKSKHLTKVSFDSAYVNTLWEVSENRKVVK